MYFFFNLHQQKQFQKAMNLVGEEFLDRVCFYRDSWLPARGLVKEALCKRQEVHLAVLIHSGEKVMLLQNSRNYCLTFLFLPTRPTTLILGGNAHCPLSIVTLDHYTFLGNCSPTPPLSQHLHLHFSLRAKYWLRGGVGGQFPRNV